MNSEIIREWALELPHVTEDFPFDEHTLVFRIAGKIFALMPLEKSGLINLKNIPERSLELREQFVAITPGYHMNKKWWNTIDFTQVPPHLVQVLLNESYQLVKAGLPKKLRDTLD
jgi:predicted DNA-binding protein (MmcQ/YjbR family)